MLLVDSFLLLGCSFCCLNDVCCWLTLSAGGTMYLLPDACVLVTYQATRHISILLMFGSAVPETAGGPLDTTGTASNIPTSAAM
ncbi:hypothetical protein Tco_0582268, partial [Tanacetum coccineum]